MNRIYRASTEAFHRQLVERAVEAMHQHFGEDNLYLAGIARAAFSSPFHLARLFRRISGVPPRHFLTAVRMEAAKRLLRESKLTVTEICLEVGFNSLGTFTKRFTELVGVSPRTYRQLGTSRMAAADGPDRLRPNAVPQPGATASVYGEISGGRAHPVVIGLFRSALPQGRPIACTCLPLPGAYRIGHVPEGRYFVLAASIESGPDLSGEPELRGAFESPVEVGRDTLAVRADITLRPRRPIDPPILLPVPLLFAQALSKTSAHRVS